MTITDRSSQFTARLVTSGAGAYHASGLLPGVYDISIDATGFKQGILEVEVAVGRVTPADVSLQVGAVRESVAVRVSSIGVNPMQTELEGMVAPEQIRNLPLNGRNFLDLGQLEPGVQLNSGTVQRIKAPYSTLSVNGQSGLTTRVTVDGVDITDEHSGTVLLNQSQDTLYEYQISRSVFEASTGLTGSGAVNVATRSGSNEVHGSGFFFWRDARGAARIGEDATPFGREQGGFTLGGPFVRDRLFFFASYERNHQNTAVATNLPGFPQFNGTWPVFFDERIATTRLDGILASGLRAFVRFTHNWNDGIVNGTLGGLSLSPQSNRDQVNQTAAGLDFMGGRFTHSFRFGYTNFDNVYEAAQSAVPGLPRTLDPAGRPLTVTIAGGDFAGGATIGPYANSPGRRFQDSYEVRYDGGFTAGHHTFRWGIDVNRIRINWFESILAIGPQINLVFTAGNQAICGNDVLCYPVSAATVANGLGFWTETPCHGLPHGCIRNDRFHWYASDNWRITPRLTLNFGLRWVYEPGPDNPDLVKPAIQDQFMPGRGARNRRDKNNFAPQFGLAWQPGKKWVLHAAAGVFYDANLLKHVVFERNQSLPFGITQDMVSSPTAIVRDPVTGATIFDMTGTDKTAHITPGKSWVSECSDPRFSGHQCPLGTPGLIDAVIAAQQAFQEASQVAAANFPSGLTRCESRRSGCVTFGANYDTPYSIQLHVGVQRELRKNLLLSVDYVRHRGLHDLIRVDQNRAGAADTLSVVNALAIMNTVQTARGCPAGPGGVDCAIAKGVTINTYANQGMGFRPNATATKLNNSAFPGVNPSFNRMQLFAMSGTSTYNALQVNLRGSVPSISRWVRDGDIVASYALSRLEAAGTFDDPALLNLDNYVDNDRPGAFHGPAALDRTHVFSAATLFTIPGGIRLSSVWHAFSSLPQSIFVQPVSGGVAEIFQTDFNGDGLGGDPLPGTNRGAYGRSLGCGADALNHVIDAYNSTQAGNLTPAGRALVNAGLFTADQLRRLGAVSPAVPRAPAGQVCLDSFITTDVRIARPIKLRGERITIEPALEWFNLFNVANYDLPDNKLSGLLSGTVGSLNGTTAANRPNRAGFSGGSFSLGAPRSWQLVVRISF